MGRPKLGDAELTRDLITDTALDILDKEGFEALSLSRIARALSVQTSALYWYFQSKSDLYTHLCTVKFRKLLTALDPALEGRELLLEFGRAWRASLRSSNGAAKLVSIAGVSEEVRTESVPALLARVKSGGVSSADARQALTAIEALALGWTVFEANPATDEVMRQVNDAKDSGFEKALHALVYGE